MATIFESFSQIHSWRYSNGGPVEIDALNKLIMLHFGSIAKVSNLLLLFTVNTIMLVIAAIDTRYNTNCLETVNTVEAHYYFF